MALAGNYPWSDARRAYAEGMTGRAVSERYGIPIATLNRRIKKENWNQYRGDRVVKVARMKLEADLSTAQKCAKIELMMIDKVMEAIATLDSEDRQGIKQMSSVIRDLKEVKIWNNDLDRAEQLARIKKLEHDCDDSKSDTTINITIASDGDELSE